MPNIKYSPEESLFIQNVGTKVTIGEEEWYHVPYWFKKTGIDTFEPTTYGKLPDHFKEFVKAQRENSQHNVSVQNNQQNDYEMNLHQHWKENEGDNHEPVIKHFQD